MQPISAPPLRRSAAKRKKAVAAAAVWQRRRNRVSEPTPTGSGIRITCNKAPWATLLQCPGEREGCKGVAGSIPRPATRWRGLCLQRAFLPPLPRRVRPAKCSQPMFVCVGSRRRSRTRSRGRGGGVVRIRKRRRCPSSPNSRRRLTSSHRGRCASVTPRPRAEFRTANAGNARRCRGRRCPLGDWEKTPREGGN